MTDAFLTQLVNFYDFNDASFGQRANAAIEKWFANLPPSKSKIDTARLGPKSVLISHLRSALLDKSGGIAIDEHPEFSKLSTREQLRFQMRSIQNNTDPWVHNEEIMPANVAEIRMKDDESTALKAMRAAVDTAKLREQVVTIDAGKLISTLLPALLEPEKHRWNAVVAALLLATGRRTVEILKTASFTLDDDDDVDDFNAIFSGQAKTGLESAKPYTIPLLAPYSLVHSALAYIRKIIDTTYMTTEAVNSAYAKGVEDYCHGLGVTTPHTLRAVYAAATFTSKGGGMTQIGWISKVLGHVSATNAAYYTRVAIINFNGPYDPERVEERSDDDDEWISGCAADAKCISSMKEMIIRRKRITASAVRTYAGGSMNTITRVMQNNKELIDEYNKSLDK